MPTALKMGTRAQRLALGGGMEAGEAPSTDEQANLLEAINGVLSGWSARAWTIPFRTRDTAMAVPSSANIYSIGTGGDFNTARPIRIDSVTLNSGDTTFPLVERTLDHYNANVIAQEQIPEFYYYEPVYPLGLLYFPTKLGTAMTVTIDSLKPLESFALITTNIDLPPGYEDAIVFNVAKRIAPEFGRPVSQTVWDEALKGEDFIRTQSNLHRKQVAKLDSALRTTRRNGYNVLSDRN